MTVPIKGDFAELYAQTQLFKTGLMGKAVEVWSSYEGGHEPRALEVADGQTLVVQLAADEAEEQLLFAYSYIVGYTESIGGDVDLLKIWLQTHDVK